MSDVLWRENGAILFSNDVEEIVVLETTPSAPVTARQVLWSNSDRYLDSKKMEPIYSQCMESISILMFNR